MGGIVSFKNTFIFIFNILPIILLPLTKQRKNLHQFLQKLAGECICSATYLGAHTKFFPLSLVEVTREEAHLQIITEVPK